MEQKILIKLNDCQNGMKVAEEIQNEYGATVLGKDTVLNAQTITKLNNLGIDKVKIYKMTDKHIEENAEFKKKYDVQRGIFKDVINGISEQGIFEIEKIKSVVDTLVDSVRENMDVLSCISEIKDADEYTYTHCVNVSLLSVVIGKWMKLDAKKLNDLVYAGLLHDIGKTKVDLEILNKPGKLTQDEYEEMKKHVLYGYRILENFPGISKEIIAGVLMHHERENGNGYIIGADKGVIHQYAKIIAVADVYDAMTSNRVYRPKICPFDVFEHMQKCSQIEFDYNIASTFLNNAANHYIGYKCKLTSGETGEIIYINPKNISHPLVKVDNDYIYLSQQSDIKVLEIL